MTILIKLTMGNIFVNLKKSTRAAPLSQNSWYIFEMQITPLLRRPHTVLPNRFYADILTLKKSIISKPLKTTPRPIPIYPVMVWHMWGPNQRPNWPYQRPKRPNWYVIELMSLAHLYIWNLGKETTVKPSHIYPEIFQNVWGPNQRPNWPYQRPNWYIAKLMSLAHLYILVLGKKTTPERSYKYP